MNYCSVMSSPQIFGNCLSNFQLHDLLVLKKSLQIMSNTVNSIKSENRSDNLFHNADTLNAPQSMALMAAERSDNGHQEYWQSNDHITTWSEEKPSKLQTLFQISITALSFLSFGGYLLCLIVQAIKSKGTTYFHPVATATTTSTNGNVKRIKIYRRSKRSSNTNDLSTLLMEDYASYTKSIRAEHWSYTHLVGS